MSQEREKHMSGRDDKLREVQKFLGPPNGTRRARYSYEIPESDAVGLTTVMGDCMEASDIYDGDYILVAFGRFPRPMMNDICLCKVDYALSCNPMVKEYIAPHGGGVHSVSTHKLKGKSWEFNEKGQLVTEMGFFTSKIYGTVVACYPADDLKHARWEIDLSELPTKIETKPIKKSEIEFVGALKGENT